MASAGADVKKGSLLSQVASAMLLEGQEPAAIKQIKSANLGLSFETNGLRARIQLERKE